MRKVKLQLDSVKLDIEALQGSEVKIYINKGRKRVLKLRGKILELYPSVFTVKIANSKSLDIQSYSFSDVLTGDVRILPLTHAEETTG